MGFAASGGNATKQLAAVRGVGPRRVSSSRRRHRRDPRGLAPPWGTGMRRGSRQTQRPASEPPGPTVAADDAPTSCLGDNGTASLPWALSTATCSAQVRRPASRPSCPSFPTPSQPQRPTPRCRQICAGTTSSCSNFPGGSVHFRPFPLEKISPAPGNRIQWIERIPDVYRRQVVPDKPPDVHGGTGCSTEDDEECLATLKHYRSLMAMAHEARKPMFHLKAADGALGGHIYAVQDCYRDFERLAKAIAEKCGVCIS